MSFEVVCVVVYRILIHLQCLVLDYAPYLLKKTPECVLVYIG